MVLPAKTIQSDAFSLFTAVMVSLIMAPQAGSGPFATSLAAALSFSVNSPRAFIVSATCGVELKETCFRTPLSLKETLNSFFAKKEGEKVISYGSPAGR